MSFSSSPAPSGAVLLTPANLSTFRTAFRTITSTSTSPLLPAAELVSGIGAEEEAEEDDEEGRGRLHRRRRHQSRRLSSPPVPSRPPRARSAPAHLRDRDSTPPGSCIVATSDNGWEADHFNRYPLLEPPPGAAGGWSLLRRNERIWEIMNRGFRNSGLERIDEWEMWYLITNVSHPAS